MAETEAPVQNIQNTLPLLLAGCLTCEPNSTLSLYELGS